MEINNLAPICLFTYNRLEETRQTVEALQTNFLAKDSVLYIFSDGWKNEDNKEKVLEVRRYIKEIQGFKEVNIIESGENKGLAQSIITGVTKVFEKYDTVIVMEDDLISSPNFLNFVNESLLLYQYSPNIQTINGYTPLINIEEDYFLFQRPFPWGWATWKKYWNIDIFNKERIKDIVKNKSILEKFSKNMGEDSEGMLLNTLGGKINSWYILWCFDHYLNNKYSLYARKTKITNVGFNDSATNCRTINAYVDNFYQDTNINFNLKKNNDLKYSNLILKYFSKRYKLKFRLHLVFKKGGLKKIYKELNYKMNGK